MHWNIQTKDGLLKLTPAMLLESLFMKHLEKEHSDFEVLTLEFAKFMQWKEALHEASLHQLFLIAFSLGYFYRIFKDKNKVEVVYEGVNNQTDLKSVDTDELVNS